VFSKAPVPGRVKSRLIPLLGEEGAARLYRELVLRTLRIGREAGFRHLQLWCEGDTDHPFFRTCAEEYGLELHVQEGGDLGERMFHALTCSLRIHRWCILVGCDIPELRVDDLVQAGDYLDSGGEAVIGPAEDGGYYLIGCTRTRSEVFTGIPWGGAEVLAMTRNRLHDLHIGVRELRICWDLDRPQDLERYRTLPGTSAGC